MPRVDARSFLRVILTAAVCLSHAARAQTQPAHEPMLVVTDDREFSVLLPLKPAVHASQGFYYRAGGEEVVARRVMHVYDAGVVYVVRVYDAARPRKLLADVLGTERWKDYVERPVTVGGVAGLERTSETENAFTKAQFFTTKKRLYVVYASARDKNAPFLSKFFSSVNIGADSVRAATAAAPNASAKEKLKPDAAPATPVTTPDDSAGPVFKSAEVTHKALLVWKPEPGYTDEARRSDVAGVVKVRLVLSSDGRVTNIQVIKGLPAGLTERAVAAATHICFLPAEKDGRPVSTWVTVEYNFNIY